ncbi:uncharacterized protein [Anabrus simplex]|uniref:uncharacterized protein n=1 Tax=Anabrus simplex TaxID=316456 RepID=UPI0035A3B13B
MTTDKVANLGQTFVCINPECFAPCFQERLGCLLDCLRKIEPADPNKPVMVPGDLERAHMKEVDESKMIAYNKVHIMNMNCIAEKMSVEPMKTHKTKPTPPQAPAAPTAPPGPPAPPGAPKPSCGK